ncbi:hypothetical protein [Moritella viscosa]|uniref:hypothetical protein n=1 Tax=Moritella viscosa TaxID=80854 RepID=UPI00091E1223|nr:hypothetical protein [Moritella viscosa]SGY86626.1 Putative uncharacterized protein [Moritella viscosa]
MVKNAIRRLVLRYFPELGQRKHLPQLARIEKIYDMPVNGASVSSAFRGYKAADIQLLDAVTGKPLVAPVFEQVSIASGQGHEHGLFVEPTPGMQCLIQYIDGLDSLPVITSLLPWHTLVPDHRSTDVSLQQSHRSKLAGTNGDWQLQTDGEIKQASQKSIVEAQTSEQSYFERSTKVATHDMNKIDGNQVNEIMGALKILVGEKAIITSLDNLLLGSNKEVKIQSAEDMHLDSAKSLIIKAKNITEDAGTIKLNGGSGVCTGATMCPFMGKPHVDVSTSVFAGK